MKCPKNDILRQKKKEITTQKTEKKNEEFL